MANICDNELHIYSEDVNNLEYVKQFLMNTFNVIDLEEEGPSIIIKFESKWTFPEELMNKLFDNLPNKKDIDMICLSIEWGCFYCEFHTCDVNGWRIEYY